MILDDPPRKSCSHWIVTSLISRARSILSCRESNRPMVFVLYIEHPAARFSRRKRIAVLRCCRRRPRISIENAAPLASLIKMKTAIGIRPNTRCERAKSAGAIFFFFETSSRRPLDRSHWRYVAATRPFRE